MSKIALSPNASGSGTFTLASPNSNTDRTLTLPDEAGTVLTSASSVASRVGVLPYFSAYQDSAQSIPSGSVTTVQLNQIEIDTNNDWDSTNYQWLPTVAGTYFVVGSASLQDLTDGNRLDVRVYKNGSFPFGGIGLGRITMGSGTLDGVANVQLIVEMNGVSDFLTLNIFQNRGSSRNTGSVTGLFAFKLP